MTTSTLVRRVATGAVAAVWLHQGLWCKVVQQGSTHEAIVAGAPFVGPARARAVTVAIGTAETALAAWVWSRRAPARAAAAQTALLIGMNVGGLLFARQRIAAPGHMVARNVAFLAVIWAVPVLGPSR